MMRENGLAKLTEEAGELMQIVGKLIQYPALQRPRDPAIDVLVGIFSLTHPDGRDLRECLHQEIADVLATLDFVTDKLALHSQVIAKRRYEKLTLFRQWDAETE